MQYVICIQNEAFAASLEIGKTYELIEDSSASKLSLVRVIDESGEDYLYPQNYFVDDPISR